ncbi:hypothetical protein [Agrobacterium tumefaciens]|uniref:hypothetical protein n=1 Tax=Agrobacterium tumefaciens TaxID=358 RepID=UPI00157243EE|nr:hypothetical protein [Agrobacterium tumefaciens]
MTVIGKDRYSENMLKNRRYKTSRCPQCKARTHEEAEKHCRPQKDITGEYSCAGDESCLNPFGVHWDTTGQACELVAADARAESRALDDWCIAEMEKMEAAHATVEKREEDNG